VNILTKFCQKYLEKYEFLNPSFSQEGEDLILSDLFSNKKTGFYVDVGAHHPKRLSNTALLYNRGWSGINIDPMISQSKIFKKLRPRDVNLGIGISKVAGDLEYFQFDEPALNTFSVERRDFLLGLKPSKYSLITTEKVPTLPLAEVLRLHMPASKQIDFLSIDVEGLDEDVLQSNDWKTFKPKVVLIEENSQTNKRSHLLGHTLLTDLGYEFVAKTNRTLFFRLQSTTIE